MRHGFTLLRAGPPGQSLMRSDENEGRSTQTTTLRFIDNPTAWIYRLDDAERVGAFPLVPLAVATVEQVR
jgi:hypothetical protein